MKDDDGIGDLMGWNKVVDGAMENVAPQTDAANGKKQTADKQQKRIRACRGRKQVKTVRVATSLSDSRVVKR